MKRFLHILMPWKNQPKDQPDAEHPASRQSDMIPTASLWRYMLHDVKKAVELSRCGYEFFVLYTSLGTPDFLERPEFLNLLMVVRRHGKVIDPFANNSPVRDVVVPPGVSVRDYIYTSVNVRTRSEHWIVNRHTKDVYTLFYCHRKPIAYPGPHSKYTMDFDCTDRYECDVKPVEDDERFYVAKLDEDAPGYTRTGVMCANGDGDRDSEPGHRDLTMSEEGHVYYAVWSS